VFQNPYGPDEHDHRSTVDIEWRPRSVSCLVTRPMFYFFLDKEHIND
jgi:hypothetical protein